MNHPDDTRRIRDAVQREHHGQPPQSEPELLVSAPVPRYEPVYLDGGVVFWPVDDIEE